MIINEQKIAKIDITGPEGNVVVTLEDDGVTKTPGYEVKVYLDLRLGPDALVKQNDVLHYLDEENIHYTVLRADPKFFTMAPIIMTDNDTVKINMSKQRTYPNNRKIGTLNDYGLVLEQVEEGEHPADKG